MLVRLIYASMAPSLRAVELADILRASRANNRAAGITGALCHLDGAYMQYLEGEERMVEALFARIALDSRHSGVRVLDRTFLAMRAFPEWSMALLSWDERIKAIFYRVAPGEPLCLYCAPAHNAAPLFRELAKTPNWVAL